MLDCWYDKSILFCQHICDLGRFLSSWCRNWRNVDVRKPVLVGLYRHFRDNRLSGWIDLWIISQRLVCASCWLFFTCKMKMHQNYNFYFMKLTTMWSKYSPIIRRLHLSFRFLWEEAIFLFEHERFSIGKDLNILHYFFKGVIKVKIRSKGSC